MGFFGHIFTDFGLNHIITDYNGEQKNIAMITGITSDGFVYTDEK